MEDQQQTNTHTQIICYTFTHAYKHITDKRKFRRKKLNCITNKSKNVQTDLKKQKKNNKGLYKCKEICSETDP